MASPHPAYIWWIRKYAVSRGFKNQMKYQFKACYTECPLGVFKFHRFLPALKFTLWKRDQPTDGDGSLVDLFISSFDLKWCWLQKGLMVNSKSLKAKDLIFWGYFASMLSLPVTWSFRNRSNILIWSSRNIS